MEMKATDFFNRVKNDPNLTDKQKLEELAILAELLDKERKEKFNEKNLTHEQKMAAFDEFIEGAKDIPKTITVPDRWGA